MDKISNQHLEQPATSESLLSTFAASLFALLIGLLLIFVATDYGHAFTTEALRRGEVAREPRLIPDFPVIDSAGKHTTLHQVFATEERVWIVDFVYTRCQSVCSSLGSVFQQLQQEILERGVRSGVGLISVSFDPENDNSAALRDYAVRMHMNPTVWNIVTLASPRDRRRLLESFGIMVVPAPLGEFEHNAALHIVGPDGRLVRIMDYDAPDQALAVALAITP